MTNICKKNFAIFHDVEKKEIYFLYNTFASCIFSKLYTDGIKNIFRNN